MAQNKTKETDVVVADFINAIDNEQKRKDSFELLRLMQQISGCEAKMWGPSIIGFGHYHYKYESGHEGDAPLIGFSPRKAAISLYIFMGLDRQKQLLDDLGKFKMGKACIYIKRLSDVDLDCFTEIAKETVDYLKSEYR
ncbi:DUF1801 domain-containing protein [Pedobacter frigoris]|uniref:DUF1801 domain-containing protein n=1 Tax=Pedobacter frigoris TaxID=2571272 RepID=A0A4U1CRD7_9SPHI|nr:DUF1801 domain-containing protein [Pedobacter frigoris]TKC09435.1 DUF1801 domain-containing protein [Pedobacter frigoris]